MVRRVTSPSKWAPRPADFAAFEKTHSPGSAWDREEWRANVLTYDPDGKNKQVFASGVRNCSGLALQPGTGVVYCATNERDLLGDNLPPDYVIGLKQGAFYGWPWYYIGNHEDTRPGGGRRPDLADKVTVPDVLIQPHSAPLGIAFDPGGQFPPDWKGDAFVALHGSWNRALRTGYKIIRLPFKDGKPTGEYQDFVVGFVADDQDVWGRPVDVTFREGWIAAVQRRRQRCRLPRRLQARVTRRRGRHSVATGPNVSSINDAAADRLSRMHQVEARFE